MKLDGNGFGIVGLVLAAGAAGWMIATPRETAPAPSIPTAVVPAAQDVAQATIEADDDDGDEVVITLADLPAAVREALAAITDEAAVTQVARETERGAATYDVEYTKNGQPWAVEFSSDGTVLENEPDDDDGEDHRT